MMQFRLSVVLILLLCTILFFASSVYGTSSSLIKNLVLYNTTYTTDPDLGRLHNGRVLDVGVIGTTSLSIIAEPENITTKGRLSFTFDGKFVRNESSPIYSINGNYGTRLIPYGPLAILGVHIISYHLYAPITNILLETRMITYSVINSISPGPIHPLILVNTETNEEKTLPNVISLTDADTNLSVIAKIRNGFSNVSYVKFWFDDVYVRTEGSAPLALNGNVGKIILPYLPLSTIGIHTITVKAYSSTGELLGEYIHCVQVVRGTEIPTTTPTVGPQPLVPVPVPVIVTTPVPVPAPAIVASPIAPTIVDVTGELRKWHKVTLAFTGPYANETDTIINPFMDYKMDVTFTYRYNTTNSKQYTIPGYFAADGNSAETSATSGDQWYCHFTPDEIGLWDYNVSFVYGTNVSVSSGSGTPTSIHGTSGTISIEASNKSGRDHRGKGRLKYVGKHHLQFVETGEYFIKIGVDSPENFLAYEDFDNTPNNLNYRKSWSPHQQDYQEGDPSWQNGKGKGIIGAINYLSNEGLNVFSFITMNIAGDDKNVFPYIFDTTPQGRLRMDVSKLAQWEILFEHADKMGMYLHFKLGEKENNELLDDGALGNERKLYYRELIARFGHHLAMNWNLSEEMNLSTEKVKEFADYIKSLDPYDTPVVVQFGVDSLQYNSLLGYPNVYGTAIQTHPSMIYNNTLRWITNSAATDTKWIVWNDHQNPSKDGLLPDSIDPNHNMIRQLALWGNIMAGGAGIQYYFGRGYNNSDVTCEDYRTRAVMWQQSRIALEFFKNNRIPFWRMRSDNSRLTAGSTDWVLTSDDGTWIVIYRRKQSRLGLLLNDLPGRFEVEWYNPRVGGPLQQGDVQTIIGGAEATVFYGNPPHSNGVDWVILLRRVSRPN